MKSIVVFFVTVLLTNYCVYCKYDCKKISACSCKFSNGEIIDLNNLANNDKTPRFADEPDPVSNFDSYSWNPCQPFSEGNCKNVAVCNIHNNIPTSTYFPLGDQDSAVFTTSGKVTKLTYVYQGTGGASRSAEITLTCDKNTAASFIVNGEDKKGNGKYFFELKTKYACVGLNGISIGTILLIVLLCLITVYLTLGIAIQIFVRKASGLERIPNYSFWVSFPGLVKDGTLFVITRGKRKAYSNI